MNEYDPYEPINTVQPTFSEVGQVAAPGIRDYLIWMLVPGLLGAFTCGIGSIILIIIWACDNKNMARANYFRATLIVAGIGIILAGAVMFFLLAIGIAVGGF